MVSQLFRVALLSPWIETTKRFPHNEWFVQYYGETVWWDDAAVYEKSKQFEIQNISNSDILFKVSIDENHSIIVAISRPTNLRVNINKNFINENNRSIHLEKIVYEKNLNTQSWYIVNEDSMLEVRREIFDSFYSKKSYEFR